MCARYTIVEFVNCFVGWELPVSTGSWITGPAPLWPIPPYPISPYPLLCVLAIADQGERKPMVTVSRDGPYVIIGGVEIMGDTIQFAEESSLWCFRE